MKSLVLKNFRVYGNDIALDNIKIQNLFLEFVLQNPSYLLHTIRTILDET